MERSRKPGVQHCPWPRGSLPGRETHIHTSQQLGLRRHCQREGPGPEAPSFYHSRRPGQSWAPSLHRAVETVWWPRELLTAGEHAKESHSSWFWGIWGPHRWKKHNDPAEATTGRNSCASRNWKTFSRDRSHLCFHRRRY